MEYTPTLAEPLLAAEESAESPASEEPLVIDDEQADEQRQGTISSACFNMWATMVGGGCLSLPLAFAKSGNGLLGPVILIGTALLTRLCFWSLIQESIWTNERKYESIAEAALGKSMRTVGTLLVVFMCFFGIVGYAVLLRDMLEPVSEVVWKGEGWLPKNAVMFTVALLVTPLCTLQTLTSLQRFGAASMTSIGVLGLCIAYRSLPCYTHHHAFRFMPVSWKDVLDVAPLYISCYVCHYNIPVVYYELQNPTVPRVQQWLNVTVVGSTLFYLMLGVAGSVYAQGCRGSMIHGNILLDFPEDDDLVLVARLCLAVTITLAFPMLTIPARDIVLRYWKDYHVETDDNDDIQEPLLEPVGEKEEEPSHILGMDEQEVAEVEAVQHDVEEVTRPEVPETVEQMTSTLVDRLLASLVVFWTGAILASCVASIDIVWDLLGSSLSILLSYLIPCGSYVVLSRKRNNQWLALDRIAAFLVVVVFVPLMFISTANAIYNTFIK